MCKFSIRAIHLAAALFFIALSANSLPSAAAEAEELRDGLKHAGALHRLQKTYRQLDYEASELIYLQSLAVQGAYGDWGTGSTTYSSDAFRLQDRTEKIRARLKQIAAAVKRSRVADDDEKSRFNDTLERFNLLLDAGLEIHRLITEKDVDAANLVWRDTSRPLLLEIKGDAYTLLSDIDSRLSRTLSLR